MYKRNGKLKYLSNKLKLKVLNQDYETIIDITDKIKEKHYIKKPICTQNLIRPRICSNIQQTTTIDGHHSDNRNLYARAGE